MNSKETNKNQILSRAVADLFVKPKGGEDLSLKIQRLRDEIKKVMESEDTIFGKFRRLEESFREVIPEENQRYNAAIKALLTTSRISRQEVVKAVNNHLEELKILEKGFSGTPSAWRDQLKTMEARAREIRDEISKLHEKIRRLESEEKELVNGMAAQGNEMELVEKAVRELFAGIRAEITYIKKRVEEPPTAERPIPQPVPLSHSAESEGPGGEKWGLEQKHEIHQPSPDRNAELQKTCPMCGGRMDLQMNGKSWMCYSCAYEELKEENVGRVVKSEIPEPSPPEGNTGTQKKCPMCGGRMDLQMNGEMWLCYSCAYEEPGKGRSG